MSDLKLIKNQAEIELKKASNFGELKQVFNTYLGTKGKVTQILRSLVEMDKKERIKIGQEANLVKNYIKEIFEQKSKHLKAKSAKESEKKEWIDVTAPGKKPSLGHLHPLTLTIRKVEEIFQTMGFSVVEGPEIENEWYNFDALNIPKDHPARDLWDTFWLKTKEGKMLLRTHTSPVQIRYMEKNNPPIRIIVPGRIYRHEATDASHECNFYQVEGLMVGKDISVANFKAIVLEFLKRLFGKPVKIRMRPSFFPFTEPSFEINMTCLSCQGKGCSVCSKTGWLEMMGAGMVHPNVLKNAGLNPKGLQGFAFGVGLDRLTLMKYRINDIRLLYGADLRFLNQF